MLSKTQDSSSLRLAFIYLSLIQKKNDFNIHLIKKGGN